VIGQAGHFMPGIDKVTMRSADHAAGEKINNIKRVNRFLMFRSLQ
jgi:hypothetical protein